MASDRSFDPTQVKSVTATVIVNVERNSPPVISNRNSYVVTVSEGIALNETILSIAASDANPPDSLNGQLVFRIVEAAAQERFIIDNAGVIRPRVELRDLASTYTFTVIVEDLGNPALSDTTSVTINVQQISRPYFDPPTSDFSIRDTEPIDTLILSIAVRDPTPDGPIVYELRGDGLGPSFFRLDVNNGNAEISVNRSLQDDSNNTPAYTIRIHAYRLRDPNIFTEHIATIRVTRNPGTPYFLHGTLIFNITETHQLESIVGSVNATDDDTGRNGEIVYSITNDVNPLYTKNYFVINEVTGDIRLIGNLLDDPVTTLYRMEVAATDRGIPAKSGYVTVYVNVTRNPEDPIFSPSQYNVTINESVPIGTSVITVTATDPQGVYYQLQDTRPASLYFRMNNQTGQIYTNAILYEDTVNSYVIKVYAFDGNAATRSAEATVEVFILRNPNYPVFAQSFYNISISEYSNIGLSVVTASATDADPLQSAGGILRYAFGQIIPEEASTLFDISPTVGEITVASQLYGDSNFNDTLVTLEVLAYDRSVSPKTSTATVQVNIVRNQFAPVFTNGTSYSLSVFDRTYVPANLLTLPVREPDNDIQLNQGTPNAQVRYLLQQDGLVGDYFEVTQTGVLRLTSNLYLLNSDNNYIDVSS